MQISDWRRDYTWKPGQQQQTDDGEPTETYLAQHYVDQPYLVGGKKFDLRIYALVTCYNPLRVYLYRWAYQVGFTVHHMSSMHAETSKLCLVARSLMQGRMIVTVQQSLGTL